MKNDMSTLELKEEVQGEHTKSNFGQHFVH